MLGSPVVIFLGYSIEKEQTSAGDFHMSRSVGLSVFSSNFETRVAAPLDSRMLVDALADLHATATWQSGDGSYYAYKGMLVCVCNDTEENNGVYRLAALPYTTSSNWVKLGSGTGTGFTWYPDDTPPDVPEIGDAYHSSTAGASLVWDGTEWQTVAADGVDGNDGENGLPGDAGANGTSSYTYWAYASDGSGTGFSFTTTPEDALYWVAQITVSAPLTPPTASDFSAATWVKYRYTPGEFEDAANKVTTIDAENPSSAAYTSESAVVSYVGGVLPAPELPDIATGDDGKVLAVVEGAWAKSDAPVSATTANVQSALGVDTENGDVAKYLNEQGTFAAASGGGGLTADETLLTILAFS